MSLLLLFQYSEEVPVLEESLAYLNFKTLIADRRNVVLGGINSSGNIYCRVDIDKYKLRWEDLKDITYKHTLSHSYVCVKCGNKITKDNIGNRYFKVNHIGKSRRWN